MIEKVRNAQQKVRNAQQKEARSAIIRFSVGWAIAFLTGIMNLALLTGGFFLTG